ncbi:MAG: MFS transporter [Verrucomicrobia bacterium]|nr:MFS transporter [Verrucomicrobiota bacterium]
MHKPGQKGATRYRFLILAALCSLAFLTYLDRICIMRVQGDLSRDLRFGELGPKEEAILRARGVESDPSARSKMSQDLATERMSWVFSAFVAGYLLFEVPAGWLGDKWGPRSVIVRIVIGWSIFTGLTGGVETLARALTREPGPEHLLMCLVVIRFLFGAGEAGAYPNIARALGRWFPYRERATAQSFIWFSSRLGGAIAPAVIGVLMAWGKGWQNAFWLLGAVGVIWSAWFWWWYRDRPEDQPAVNEEERRWIASDAAGSGTIYDDASPARMPWRALLSINVLALCLASFCVSFCFYFYITFLPKYLKDQFQVDYAGSQWMSGLPLLCGGIACLAGGRLSDGLIRRLGSRRWGRSLMPMLGWFLAGLLAWTVPWLDSPMLVVAALALGFACQDLGVPSMWSVPADLGGKFAGTLGGWMNSAGALGGMLSPLVAAKISIQWGWNSAFVLFGCVYLVGAVAWLRVDASKPITSKEP